MIGYAKKVYANGSYTWPTHPYYVKVSSSITGNNVGPTQTGATDDYGHVDYSLWKWQPSLQVGTTYYIFIWDNGDRWGSPTVPIYSFVATTSTGFCANTIAVYPAPLPPAAVTPYEGQINTGTSFNLQWRSGQRSPQSERIRR